MAVQPPLSGYGRREMSIGVDLSDEDLEAVRRLFNLRWGGDIKNWKERDVDGCLWLVSCPDKSNNIITETGQSLADTINTLLERALQ